MTAKAENWQKWYADNREARREYMKRYRAANKDRIKEKQAEWQAANADHARDLYRAWFAKNAEQKRKADRDRMASDPVSRLEKQREWRRKYPEHSREVNQRRRARQMNAPAVERVDRADVYKRDGGKCHICGKKVPHDAYTLDHLVPLARGGEHTPRNLRVAHKSCNSRRGAGRLPAQLLLIG